MPYYRYRRIRFSCSGPHGLGILYNWSSEKDTCQCFYEDDTTASVPVIDEITDEIECFGRFSDDRWYRATKKDKLEKEELLQGTCRVFRDQDQIVCCELEAGKLHFLIRVVKGRFGKEAACSCGSSNCIHMRAAGELIEKKIADLKHQYVVTDQKVDKTLLLDPALTACVLSLREQEIDQELIKALRNIIDLLESAKSDDYFWLFHHYLLDLSPYDYDSRFLEDSYSYMLLTLFDNDRYQRGVLSDPSFAEKEDYEDRQHRSNRACLKRVLKDYRRAVREMDDNDDYQEDDYKEVLLKFRGSCRRLLHYYAVGKEHLDSCDIPFLEEIADKAHEDLTAVDVQDIAPAIKKLDRMRMNDGILALFQYFAKLLSHEERLRLYSGLKQISLSAEEISQLPEEEQLQLIDATPLNVKSFTHIMDDLLAPMGSREQGRYILKCVRRITPSMSNLALRKTVAQHASLLPDNRLLLSYVCHWMRVAEKFQFLKGVPEKELDTYFDCSYEIVNHGSSFSVEYLVRFPESDQIILKAAEVNGKLQSEYVEYGKERYFAAVIRKTCLLGREEEYEEAIRKNQESVDAFLFEKKNRRFVSDYRRLCDSLSDEKLLFKEDAKAGIEWLLYRNEGCNSLAFRVGNRKKYVVKDAREFLAAFAAGQTVEYGKDLILTHDTENLEEADAAPIKLLMSAKTTRGARQDPKNKRYISFSDVVMASLLELLAGRTVMLNEIPCLIRMEPVKVRLQVSDRYVLSTNLDKKTQTFMNLQGKGYILTRQTSGVEQVIDRMDQTAEETGLVDLVDRNPSVNVKPILPDFKKNIYSRFFEMMDVDKKVEKEFVLSQIRCSTYFDYERSAITARTVISKEGKEIEAQKLTDRIDQQKYQMLQNYLGTLGFTDGVMEEEGHILSFFKLDFTRLKKLTNVYLSETLQKKELRSVGKPVIRVSYQNHMVQVFLEKSEFNDAEMEKIIAALRKKKKFILLSGDRIIDLDSEAAKDLGEAVRDFGMDPKELHKKKTVSMVTAIKAFSHEQSCSIDKYLRTMIEEIRSFKDADIELPPLEGELRDYQAEGYRWLSVLSKYHMGGVLADEMGLGKTIQVIALIRSDPAQGPSLVVCPKSLVFNWMSEFARFDPKTKVTAVFGPESRRSEIIAGINYQEKTVYVTSYDSLRIDIEKYEGEFQYSILDEAQYIKNVHAQKTRSVKEIKAQHRFALTGTPIENSVIDLWSIFDYIMPGYFDELSHFKDSDHALIARKSAPFILRRVKDDVLDDLPAKYETILSADMSEGQRKLYDALRADARKQLEKGGKAFDLLPYLTRLRQVCVDPGMFVEDYKGGSGKLEMLKTLVPRYLEEGHRILIFSQFVKALESVRHMLEKIDIPVYFLSGATPARDRMEMMDSFNNGSGTDVFLISLKAGGTGLNLTGADTVIHLDPWWNVAAENQASDRTHRIGQTRNVEIIKLIAGDSIEQRVVELQNIKKEVIRQVISDNDGSVTSASLEDIAFVLE